MANTMADDTVVMALVIISGQFESSMPWITKKMLPNPRSRKVGRAMPSVSRADSVDCLRQIAAHHADGSGISYDVDDKR